jgi:hypothetical protein
MVKEDRTCLLQVRRRVLSRSRGPPDRHLSRRRQTLNAERRGHVTTSTQNHKINKLKF